LIANVFVKVFEAILAWWYLFSWLDPHDNKQGDDEGSSADNSNSKHSPNLSVFLRGVRGV